MKYLEAAFLACMAVFAPIKAVLITTLVLVLLDTVTGVYAAWKRKEPITSAQLRRSITKIFVYELALGMAFLAQQYLIGDTMPVCKLVSTLIGLVETKSILESLDEVNGKPIFTSLIASLGSKNDNL